jgi:hypothetical protein
MNSTVAPNWGCGSDARLKDTSPLPDETQSVLRLKPVAFTWKSDPDKHPHLGFTAQDVERYFPQLVYTDPHAGTKMLATEGLIAPLVKTIQELAARIDVLEREVKAMQVRP